MTPEALAYHRAYRKKHLKRLRLYRRKYYRMYRRDVLGYKVVGEKHWLWKGEHESSNPA